MQAEELLVLHRSARGAEQESNYDVTQCSDDHRILTSREINRKIHELTCGYMELRHQVDGWVDEFNSIVYFINEIGVNMNAAKQDIEDNKRKLSSLHSTNHSDTLGGNLHDQVIQLETFINLTNQKADRQFNLTQLDLLNLRSQLGDVTTSLDDITRRLNETSSFEVMNASRSSTPVSRDFSYIDDVRKLNEKSRKNNLLINGNKNSLRSLRNQLEGFNSEGWFNAPNGFQYLLSNNAYITNAYTRSRRYCRNRNSDLAFVGMRDERIFRYLWMNLLGPSRSMCIWMGLSDVAEEGVWRWMDGQDEKLFWSNWAGGEARRSTNREDCAMIRAGMWIKGSCNNRKRLCTFLCERRIIRIT